MDLLDGLLKMGSALAIVLALVVLAALGARRWLAPVLGAARACQPVRLVSSLALGGRRSVLVLDVQGHTLVVGATPQSLILLTEFGEHHAATIPVATPVMPNGGAVPESPLQAVFPSRTWRDHLTNAAGAVLGRDLR